MRGGSFSWILFPFIQKEKTFFLFVSGQESHFLTAGVGRAAGWWRRSPSGLPVGGHEGPGAPGRAEAQACPPGAQGRCRAPCGCGDLGGTHLLRSRRGLLVAVGLQNSLWAPRGLRALPPPSELPISPNTIPRFLCLEDGRKIIAPVAWARGRGLAEGAHTQETRPL